MPDRYLQAIVSAETSADLWALHVAMMGEFGFDRLLYGFTRFRTPHGFGDRDDFLVLSNHDPAYVEAFVQGGLYFDAPMVRWAAANDGACSWRHLIDRADSLTEAERRVVEFNHRHGVDAGYSISFRDASSRNKGAIALTARRGTTQDAVDAVWAEHGSALVMMNTVAHLKLITLPYATTRVLTARQREVLEWARDGKTTQDIATVMGLTPATVEKHFRLARHSLDVETTAQAVLKASFQNQIFVVER